MIDRLPVAQVMPAWKNPPGDRYVSHPSCRTAMIQLLDDPEYVYVVADEALPVSVQGAIAMTQKWRTSRETAED